MYVPLDEILLSTKPGVTIHLCRFDARSLCDYGTLRENLREGFVKLRSEDWRFHHFSSTKYDMILLRIALGVIVFLKSMDYIWNIGLASRENQLTSVRRSTTRATQRDG